MLVANVLIMLDMLSIVTLVLSQVTKCVKIFDTCKILKKYLKLLTDYALILQLFYFFQIFAAAFQFTPSAIIIAFADNLGTTEQAGVVLGFTVTSN